MEKHKVVKLGCFAVLAVAMAAPISAHHSAAGYDTSKTLSAKATLKEFRWGAPHASVVFVIKGPNGKDQNVFMAAGAPAAFARQGVKARDLKVGDKMDITWFPSKTGVAGQLVTMKLPDGRTYTDVEFGPGGTQLERASGPPEGGGGEAPQP